MVFRLAFGRIDEEAGERERGNMVICAIARPYYWGDSSLEFNLPLAGGQRRVWFSGCGCLLPLLFLNLDLTAY